MNTYNDLVAAFRDITADPSGVFFSDSVLQSYAGQALYDLAEHSHYRVEPKTALNASGSGLYAVSNAYGVWRVEYDDEALIPITRDRLRVMDRQWENRDGNNPRFYYLDQTSTNADYVMVGLYEQPSPPSTIVAWTWEIPTLIASDAELDVPNWACGGVLFYMLMRAYEAETKLQNFETSALYGALYEDIRDRLVSRGRDHSGKKWVFGEPSRPSMSVLNRLPERITP